MWDDTNVILQKCYFAVREIVHKGTLSLVEARSTSQSQLKYQKFRTFRLKHEYFNLTLCQITVCNLTYFNLPLFQIFDSVKYLLFKITSLQISLLLRYVYGIWIVLQPNNSVTYDLCKLTYFKITFCKTFSLQNICCGI